MPIESRVRFRPGREFLGARLPCWTVSIAAAAIYAMALHGCVSPAPEPSTGEIVVQVLPFEVIGQTDGADYLGRAAAESLSISLAQAENLRCLDVPDGSEPADDTATRRIEATLIRDGDAVTARLRVIEAGNREPSWQTEVTSDGAELSRLISRLSNETVRSMGGSQRELYQYVGDITGGPEMSRSSLTTPTMNAWRRGDSAGFLETSKALVAEFPEDPAAHVLNAWALLLAWDASPSKEPTLAQLRERLVALDQVDASSPYDELIRAYVYRSSGQPEAARSLYSRVLARRDLSSFARAWALRQRSYTYLQAGNALAAADDAEAAIALDPSNASSHIALSKALEALGRLDEAIVRSNQALALQSSWWRHHQRLGLAQFRAERFDDAVRSVDRACQISEHQEACANLAVVLHGAGRKAEARAAAEHAETLTANRWGFYNLACYHAREGERPLALDALRRAIDLGFADLLISTDPDLEGLRDDPSFAEIEATVEERLDLRRELSQSVFPWQA